MRLHRERRRGQHDDEPRHREERGFDHRAIDQQGQASDDHAGSDEQTTRLQITSSGEWYIEIRPLSTARRVSVPGTIEGASDDVVIIDGEPDTALIRGNPDSRHFAVIAYGDRYNLLVNTTDPYDGRVIVARDAVVLEVNAEGAWTITFE